jgi:hypothetical protein
MKRKTIAIVLATLALFAWNAISWMGLPFHGQSLQPLPDAVVEFTKLSSVRLEDGVYHYPGFPEDNSPESLQKLEQKLATGPRIPLMVYKSGPSQLFNPTDFLQSLLINLFTVGALYLLLAQVKPQDLRATLLACLLAAMLTGFASDLALMNWYKLSLEFVIPNMADHIIGFCLAGIILFSVFFKRLTYVA